MRAVAATTFLLTALVAACGAANGGAAALSRQQNALEARAATTFTNPVIAADFPDPCMLRVGDTYYAYATQGAHDGHLDNIACAKSTDMVHWQLQKDALPTKPAWADKTQNFWAPHVIQQGARFLMYFAGQSNNPPGKDGFRMGIGVATATSPGGPFKPLDTPIELEDSFAAIDPFVMTDPASHTPYMFWGSGFQPLRARALTPDGLAFAPNSSTVTVLAPQNAPYEHLIEGAWVRERNGTFYLFYSGDDCCTDVPGVGAPTYAVMVAKASAITGPYTRLTDATGTTRPILHGNTRWLAPGHNAVVTDPHGTDWLVYHAIDALQRNTPGTKDLRRCLLIDPITYTDGWPRIADDSPSTGSLHAPTFAAP